VISFSWSVAGPPARSPIVAAAGAVIPFTSAMDPMTGARLFDRTRNSLQAGSPYLEVAIRVVRTPLGTALRDPKFGVDYARLDNARDNAVAVARQVFKEAFQRWTARGEIRALVVTPEVHEQALLVDLEFKDRWGAEFALSGMGSR
jgi:phage baseplate assembly protein W